MRVRVTTKFNCTNTGTVGHHKTGDLTQWNRARNQQRNFESLTQIVSLYTQPYNLTDVTHNVETNTWSFEFETEFEGIFRTGTDELGILKSTSVGTPMMTGLEEDNDLNKTLTPDENIWFEILE